MLHQIIGIFGSKIIGMYTVLTVIVVYNNKIVD